MNVSKSVSIDANDLVKIDKLVKSGKIVSISDFMQKATKLYLEKLEMEE